jgi:hypothetical protein
LTWIGGFVVTIESANLSNAWGEAFIRMMARGVDRIEPLVVSITGFDDDGRPAERPAIAAALDAALQEHETNLSVRTVANTLFPDRWWRPGVARAALYERYLSVLPRLRRDRRNRHGIYFERLIRFGGDPERSNQLEYVLGSFEQGRHAISSLQVAVFDPLRDLSRATRRGFPCLQHVAFGPDVPAGTLTVSGFYASQNIFERAYGNYRGLCLLGRFMATQMGLRLAKVVCIAAQARLAGNASKTSLRNLEQMVGAVLGGGAGGVGVS